MFEYAAQQGTHLITTYVHDGDKDDEAFVSDTKDIVEQSGGVMYFVRLTAPNQTLLDRVANESRTRFHKLTDRSIMQDFLEQRDTDITIDHENTLTIDTSTQSAQATAKQIAEYFQLES